jgi:cysteinyl-tRNA synthetase
MQNWSATLRPPTASNASRRKNAAGRRALAGTLGFFGFRRDELKAWQTRRAPEPPLAVEEIERRITARNDARKAKDFKESDRIRDELAKMGVVLKDSKDGTTWEVAR